MGGGDVEEGSPQGVEQGEPLRPLPFTHVDRRVPLCAPSACGDTSRNHTHALYRRLPTLALLPTPAPTPFATFLTRASRRVALPQEESLKKATEAHAKEMVAAKAKSISAAGKEQKNEKFMTQAPRSPHAPPCPHCTLPLPSPPCALPAPLDPLL